MIDSVGVVDSPRSSAQADTGSTVPVSSLVPRRTGRSP